MLPDKMEHCIVFMNSWDVSGAFWSFSKCNIIIPRLPADPSSKRKDMALAFAAQRIEDVHIQRQPPTGFYVL